VAVHIYTQTIHRTTQITTEQHKYKLMWKSAGHAPSLQVLPWHLSYNWGKSAENLSQSKKNLSQVKKNLSQSTVYIYQNTHTLENPHKHIHYKIHTHTHTHTHTHIAKQYKTTTVQIKTKTVQDIPKWNSQNTIKCPQYKVTLMYIAHLSTRTSP
jgi:hypothetical protein